MLCSACPQLAKTSKKQETKKGNLRGGLLLMTPTEHNRFEHYDKELRKES